jgi:phosphonate transport system ATP-binding protein
MARAYFDRIVALRDGRLMFDAPAAQVSDEMLRELYADHEDELTSTLEGAAPYAYTLPGETIAERPMTCR